MTASIIVIESHGLVLMNLHTMKLVPRFWIVMMIILLNLHHILTSSSPMHMLALDSV